MQELIRIAIIIEEVFDDKRYAEEMSKIVQRMGKILWSGEKKPAVINERVLGYQYCINFLEDALLLRGIKGCD